jgi:hypothetical protein
MEDYEIETIKLIREAGVLETEFPNGFPDTVIYDLYKQYSAETACAGWISGNQRTAEDFVYWATTSPLVDYLGNS